MTIRDAHTHFMLRPDGGHGLLPEGCDQDTSPLFCTAVASLSGMLESSKTDADLDEAVAHAMTLIRMETVTQDDLHTEVEAVLSEVDRQGRELLGIEQNR